MNVYFVTGATGAVGSALCERLLQRPDVELRLLIRGKDDQDVANRLNKLFDFWGATLGSPVRTRVRALRGDATLRRFGLDATQYDLLARQSTHVVHSAGAVRMNLPIEAARHSAIDSAKEIIALERLSRERSFGAKVEFISTVGVGGRLSGPLPERWITESRTFHNTYEQAKAEAEALVRDAIVAGARITVHRPSMVVGDSATGKIMHFQVFYHLAEFLSGRRTFGIGPDPGNASLDLIPADCVAAAVEWSSQTPDAAGSILHLCAGPQGSITVRDLIQFVRKEFASSGLALPKLRIIPPLAFRTLTRAWALVASEQNKRALRTLPVFLDYLSDAQTFDNTQSKSTLERAGLHLPKSTEFLPVVLRHYLATRENS